MGLNTYEFKFVEITWCLFFFFNLKWLPLSEANWGVIIFWGGWGCPVKNAQNSFSLAARCVHILVSFEYVAQVKLSLKGAERKNCKKQSGVSVPDCCGTSLVSQDFRCMSIELESAALFMVAQ